jgi:hypothetical protein
VGHTATPGTSLVRVRGQRGNIFDLDHRAIAESGRVLQDRLKAVEDLRLLRPAMHPARATPRHPQGPYRATP